MKECTKCKNSFPEETYYIGRNNTRRAECRDCHSSRIMKCLYGIELSEYKEMLTSQNGGCAICNAPEPEKRRLNIDHDHITGEVRGLLCWRCNVTLGKVDDNPELLHKMANYLEDF